MSPSHEGWTKAEALHASVLDRAGIEAANRMTRRMRDVVKAM
jgi:hypothetical protein